MAAASDGKAATPAAGAATADAHGIQINEVVEIRCDPDHVFDFMSDGERLPAWMAGVKRAKRTSAPGVVGAGTAYRIVGTVLGRRVESRYELTAYEPRQMFSSRMYSRFFRVEHTYRFEEADGVTKVTLTEKAVPLGRFKLLGPLLFLAAQRQVRADHRKLKDVLERSKGLARSGSGKAGQAATEG